LEGRKPKRKKQLVQGLRQKMTNKSCFKLLKKDKMKLVLGEDVDINEIGHYPKTTPLRTFTWRTILDRGKNNVEETKQLGM